MKKQVTIVIPCWKRSFVFSMVAKQLSRIINKYDYVNVMVGVSEEDNQLRDIINICRKYDFQYVYTSNAHLGQKLNDIIEQAFISFPQTEYIMNLGSDDLLHEDIFDLYKPYMQRGEKLFGVDSVYLWNIEDDRTLLFSYDDEKVVGAGRMIHRSIPFPIYSPKCQSALDSNSTRHLTNSGYSVHQIKSGSFPYIVDIKTDINICGFDNFVEISKNVKSNIIRENYDLAVTVNSYNCEFGYELLSVVPYAYWLNERGLLKETISGKKSEPIYYFSPKHTISDNTRSYRNIHKVAEDIVPNTMIHVPYINLSTFKIPPYRKIYANREYKYKKPTICICNRYNREWNRPPINYFDLDCLKELFTKLQNKYQIIYIATSIPEDIQDGAHSMELGDYELAKKYPKVIVFQDLVKDNWNEVLLKVFANCERFITMNGGYSILASFFGGQNIIYSKRGKVETRELKTGSFWRWYPEFNNAQIRYASTYDELCDTVNTLFVEKLPTVNILIRTCRRIDYFRQCIESIKAQTYKNINVIVGIENGDVETIEYAYKYPYRVVHYEEVEAPEAPEVSSDYGVKFPYNQYLNVLTQKVGNGYIMYLDDDDHFITHTAVEDMVREIEKSDVIFWRVNFKKLSIPSNDGWEKLKSKIPTVCDISGIGFMFHSRFKNYIDWGYWKRGDYRVAKKLCSMCKIKLLDKELTGVQTRPHRGSVPAKSETIQKEVTTLPKYSLFSSAKRLQHKKG